MSKQSELAKALSVAIEVIRLQQHEINGLKTMLFALRESVESGKPPLPFDAAQRQVLEEMRESGHTPDDIIPLLNEYLEKVRSLAK